MCRGVPRGPHIPHEELGGQREAWDQRQRHKDKYYPFCQKQGICTLKNVTKKGNMEPTFKFQTQKTLGGHLWKEEKEHKERNKVEDVIRSF